MSHTLESISKLAGVSRGTVSRVINQQPGVKAEVRERVLRIVEETGYAPNAQARSLAGGKTENIGVVVFGYDPLFLTHHIFYEVLQGIQSHSILNSYDLLLFSNRTDQDEQYWRKIGDRRKVDGLVIMGEVIKEEYLAYYHAKKIPYVIVGKRNVENLPLFCVTSNYRQGAYLATRHLIEENRCRIVFVRGILDTYHEEERYAGYVQALTESGIEVDPALILHGDANKALAYEVMKKLIAEQLAFDAVFAANDLMAAGVLEALQEINLKVPEQIAVVGFDDIQTAAYFTPPLTTVKQNKTKLGQEAVQLLMKLMINEVNQNESIDVVVDTELIIRESSVYREG